MIRQEVLPYLKQLAGMPVINPMQKKQFLLLFGSLGLHIFVEL